MRASLIALILSITFISCTPDIIPHAGQGIMVGEVTSESAFIQVRLTTSSRLVDNDLAGQEGYVLFVLTEANAPTSNRPILQTVYTNEQTDFIARAHFTNLKPGIVYHCRTEMGALNHTSVAGPSATFQTLHGPGTPASTDFVVVTGMNYAKYYAKTEQDRHIGYPALEAIEKLKPDFFVGTGDNVYYDRPFDTRAETIPELRQKWHEQFVQSRFQSLFASVPTYWMIDDHDYRIDDADNTGDYAPLPAVGRQLMLEQLPVAADTDTNAKTYRTHRISKDLQVWFPENRMYRSPNANPDDSLKTIWGAEQKAWLKQTLLASDATFKLLVSPTPMIGPDDLRKTDNHTNHNGFRYERDAFFDWLQESGLDKNNFYIVTGDRHWQYHSIHPSGLEEFSSGALVDANARLGRKPGDPKSTDPEALINQVYTQAEPSGGFLMVSVTPEPATLSFTWYDENGVVLNTASKVAD